MADDLSETVDFPADGLEGWTVKVDDRPLAVNAAVRFLAIANSPASVALFDRLNGQLPVRLAVGGYAYRVAIHGGERVKTPAIDRDEIVYLGRVVGIEASTSDCEP